MFYLKIKRQTLRPVLAAHVFTMSTLFFLSRGIDSSCRWPPALTRLIILFTLALHGSITKASQEDLCTRLSHQLPQDIAQSLNSQRENPAHTLTVVYVRLGSNLSLTPLCSGYKLSDSDRSSMTMTHACLTRARSAGLPLTATNGVRWLILTPGTEGGHTLSALNDELNPVFRVDCPNNPTIPGLSLWPNALAPSPATTHNARLLSVKGLQPLTASENAVKSLFPNLMPLLAQFRARFSNNQIQNLNKLQNSWQTNRYQLTQVPQGMKHWRSISGSSHTKHGILAERLQIGAMNAQSAALGGSQVAHATGLPLNHPVDFFLHNQPVQAKCHGSAMQTLRAINTHLQRYQNHPDFQHGIYMIPKDQFSELKQLLAENPVHLSANRKELQNKAEQLLKLAGADNLEQFILPAVASRAEMEPVQLQTTTAKLEQEYTHLYRHTRYKQMIRYGTYAFLSGFATGASLQAVSDFMSLSPHQTKKLEDSLYSIITSGLYGSLASSGTFFLSTGTGLPTPLSAGIMNIGIRTFRTTLTEWYEGRQIPKTTLITIVGEEAFAGLGATAFNGNLAGQLAGSFGGLMLWQSLQRNHNLLQ